MKKYRKNLILALVCFLIVIVLNFFLPRLLPGNPIAYLTGFSEEDMTPAQVAYYRQALHLDKPVFVQFGYYLRSLADGTLGYSYKKEATVSTLIGAAAGIHLTDHPARRAAQHGYRPFVGSPLRLQERQRL